MDEERFVDLCKFMIKKWHAEDIVIYFTVPRPDYWVRHYGKSIYVDIRAMEKCPDGEVVKRLDEEFRSIIGEDIVEDINTRLETEFYKTGITQARIPKKLQVSLSELTASDVYSNPFILPYDTYQRVGNNNWRLISSQTLPPD